MAYVKRQKKVISIDAKKERRANAKLKRKAEEARQERIGTVFSADVISGKKTLGEKGIQI